MLSFNFHKSEAELFDELITLEVKYKRFHQTTVISIYTFSDLGVLSNLIGSLSLANEHYSQRNAYQFNAILKYVINVLAPQIINKRSKNFIYF